MKIINMSKPQEAARLALRTNSRPVEVTDGDELKIELALRIAWDVFGEELGRELAGIYVYESVNENDYDAFVYDDGEQLYMVMSSLAASREFPEIKYYFCESLFSAYAFGAEDDVDVVALAVKVHE